MFYQNRRHNSSYRSIAIGVILFFALIVLTTGIAFAAPAYDHQEACSVNVSTVLAAPLEVGDFGAEFDTRLGAELEAVKCTVAELELAFGPGVDLFLPHEFPVEITQGFDQDLRLGEELSFAQEVVASFNARQLSVERIARQIAAQEARDVRLVSELAFEVALGIEQDLRLGAELSASREAVVSLNSR